MLSGHDYRSKRQANIHFIVRELAKTGRTRLFSPGFSYLSLLKKDPRTSLWNEANIENHYKDVDCFLWRTLIHPVNLKKTALSCIEKLWFKFYVFIVPSIFKKWVKESDVIIIESGMSVIFFDLIKQLNPKAKIVYLCSDALSTIGCATTLINCLERTAPQFDAVCVPSRKLSNEFPDKTKLFFVPHGIDTEIIKNKQASPFAKGTHLVSVGSMLFDANFFKVASKAFPNITFHIIGAGKNASGLSADNIIIYNEMPFESTLAYLQHADAGIAPYQGDKVSPYLIDTSMKLMQYELLGLPAICPISTVGEHKGRYGYIPGNKLSIINAINDALIGEKPNSTNVMSWKDVTLQLLNPTHNI